MTVPWHSRASDRYPVAAGAPSLAQLGFLLGAFYSLEGAGVASVRSSGHPDLLVLCDSSANHRFVVQLQHVYLRVCCRGAMLLGQESIVA